MTRYSVSLTKKALKQLEEIDEQARRRILEALVTLRDYGFTGRLDIGKLRGHRDHYWLRVGRYRVLVRTGGAQQDSKVVLRDTPPEEGVQETTHNLRP